MGHPHSGALGATWTYPDALVRTLAKFGATPDDLLRPVRISRHMRLQVNAKGHESEMQMRELVQGGPERTRRMFAISRCRTLPHPPTVTTEGAQLERFRADPTTMTCAFELTFDRPLKDGELAMVETTIRYPPGQTDTNADWRILPSVRDLVIRVDFDAVRLPTRCVYYHQLSASGPKQALQELPGDHGSGSFQFATLDPTPGIYGVAWEWPEQTATP